MKNEKYHAVRTVPKSNRKIPRCQKSSEIVKRGKVDITQIHGSSLYWLGEGTSLKVLELIGLKPLMLKSIAQALQKMF